MAKVNRLRSPTTAYVATRSHASDASVVRAKLFANGRSQAVRLPKQFRMPGTAVRISREGDRVILEPITAKRRDANGWPLGFWDNLDALGGGADFPDAEPLPGGLLDLDPADQDGGARA